MSNQYFVRKTLVLQMLAALLVIASAAPYQQCDCHRGCR